MTKRLRRYEILLPLSYNDGAEGVARFYRVHGDELAESLAAEGNLEGAADANRRAHEARYEY